MSIRLDTIKDPKLRQRIEEALGDAPPLKQTAIQQADRKVPFQFRSAPLTCASTKPSSDGATCWRAGVTRSCDRPSRCDWTRHSPATGPTWPCSRKANWCYGR